MNKIAAIVTLCVLAGCHASGKGAPESDKPAKQVESDVPVVTVQSVATMVQDHSATVFDANDSKTRQEYGVIPGAVLLSNYKEYAMSELPQSKTQSLVFYCGGTACRASDAAAKRALEAGYEHVAVLRAGIRGWKDAGQATTAPQS